MGCGTFPDNRRPKLREEIGPTGTQGPLLGDTGQTRLCREIFSKEPLRVGGTPRSSRKPRGVDLHQKVSYLRSRSCGHLLGLRT